MAQTALTRRGRWGASPPPAVKATAVTFGAAALVLMGGTAAQFGNARTTVDPEHPSRASTLIVTGPNRLTRNPIYLGFAGLLVAHALWRGSMPALLPVVGFAAALSPQIRREEEALLTRFGQSYSSYSERVPRWLGRATDRR